MILGYIDWIFGGLVGFFLVSSIALAVVGTILVVQNVGARISVVRAINLQPTILALAATSAKKEDLQAKIQKLVEIQKSKSGLDVHEIIETTIFLLNEQSKKFIIRTSRSGQMMIPKEHRFDQKSIAVAINLLSAVVDDHAHFTAIVDEIVDRIQQVNKSSVEGIMGKASRVLSISNFIFLAGGRNRNTLNYFVAFLFRDAVMELTSFHLSFGVGNREII